MAAFSPAYLWQEVQTSHGAQSQNSSQLLLERLVPHLCPLLQISASEKECHFCVTYRTFLTIRHNHPSHPSIKQWLVTGVLYHRILTCGPALLEDTLKTSRLVASPPSALDGSNSMSRELKLQD